MCVCGMECVCECGMECECVSVVWSVSVCVWYGVCV